MKLYLKIVFSTMLGALAYSIICIVGSIVINFDFKDIFPDLIPGFMIVMAVVGFIIFGIVGSALWYVLYRFFFSRRKSLLKAHIWSVAIGAILPPLLMVLGESNRVLYSLSARDISRYIGGYADDYLEFLAFTIPGGVLSLFFYWLLFLRGRIAYSKSGWLRNNSSNQQ